MNTIPQHINPATELKRSRQMRRAAKFAPGGSIKIRVGGRMMLMVWRKRARVAALLGRLLWRSLRQLAVGVAIAGVSSTVSYALTTAPTILPTNGVVSYGNATINPAVGNTLTISQTSKQAIVNWGNFNIGAGNTVTFQQPDATSSILNRVGPGLPSFIYGQLTANGKVWLINPAGIMIGAGAKIDVAGFVASNLYVSNSDFLKNNLQFTNIPVDCFSDGCTNSSGIVSNNGSIKTSNGGSVYLVGTKVENGSTGAINASKTVTDDEHESRDQRSVILAGGDTVTITFADTTLPGLNVAVTGKTGTANNFGQIFNDAGRIGLAAALVSNSNKLDVGVTSTAGRIFLKATQSATIGAGSDISIGASGVLSVDGPAIIKGANLNLAGGSLSATGSVDISDSSLSNLTMTTPGLVSFSGTNVLSADLTLSNVAINTNASLSGAGKLTATNLSWSESVISGASTDRPYDVTNLTLIGKTTLDGRTLNLLKDGTSAAKSGTIVFKNSGVLNNAGTFTISDQTQLGYFDSPNALNGVINNTPTGTIISTNTSYGMSKGYTGNYLGGGYDTFNSVSFNNAGTIKVLDGQLHLGGSGTHSGSFKVGADIQGKTSTLFFGVSNKFPTVRMQNIEVGSTFSDTSANGGRAVIEFANAQGTTTNLNTDIILNNAALSFGRLQGSGKLTAINFNWSGGVIKGGPTNAAYDVTNLTLTGSPILNGRTMNLVGGGVSQVTGANMTFNNSAVLNNAGTLTVVNGARLGYYDSPTAGASVINNTGTIISANSVVGSTNNTIGGAYDAINGTAFNNSGTVTINDSSLTLSGSGIQTGTFNINASAQDKTATLNFGKSSIYSYSVIENINSGAAITETANNGGTATVNFGNNTYGGGATNLNTNLSLANVDLSAGTLQGSGKLTATNLKWSGGTIARGGRNVYSAYDVSNLTLTKNAFYDDPTLDGRTLNLLKGGVSKATNATLTFTNSAVLNNLGTLTLADGSQLGYNYSSSAGASVINNTGTLNSTNTSSHWTSNSAGSTWDSRNAIAFNNSGTVNITDGSLMLGGGGTQTGQFNINASVSGKASTLIFGDNSVYSYSRVQNINTGATITETATNGGIASVNFGNSPYSSETTNLNTNLSLANVAITGGILQGSGKLTATNLNWYGGTIAGLEGASSYDVTNLVLSNAFVPYFSDLTSYSAGRFLDGRTLNLVAGGNSLITGSTLSLNNHATLNNAGMLTLMNGGSLAGVGNMAGGGGTINNAGTIDATNSPAINVSNGTSGTNYYGGVVSGLFGDNVGRSVALKEFSFNPTPVVNSIGSSSYYGGVELNNTGSLHVRAGTLQIFSPIAFNNQGQIQIEAGTTLATNSDLTNAQGAKISGSGSITLNEHTLVNHGVIAPGSSTTTGSLIINGNYTQGNTGELIAKIASNATDNDSLNVSGTTKLDGQLTVVGLPGYVPGAGDYFNFIKSSIHSESLGTFARFLGPGYLNVGYGLHEGVAVSANFVPDGVNFFDNTAGDFNWSNVDNWSLKYKPVSASDVMIDTGFTVQHAAGEDKIHSLVVSAKNGLNISGGSLMVSGASRIDGTLNVGAGASALLNGGLTGAGSLLIAEGNVNLGSASSIANLGMTGGVLSSAANFAVTNSLQQTGGALQFAGAKVDLHQSTGDLLINNLTANTANLVATNGAIAQTGGALTLGGLTTQSTAGTRLDGAANQITSLLATNTGTSDIAVTSLSALALTSVSNTGGAVSLSAGGAITQTGAISGTALTTSSIGGTTLNGANRVSSFSALNTGSGDISLVNTTRPDAFTLLAVTNTVGSIAIDNTGAIITSGTLNAAGGTLQLTAHSPITVNSGLAARDGITLNALPSSLGIDTVAINGTLTSTAGNILISSGTSTTVGSNATLQVTPGAVIALTALEGEVDIIKGATFVGAQPTISQSVVALVVPQPPLVAQPFIPVEPITPSQPPQNVAFNIIDNLQKTTSQFDISSPRPTFLASLAASSDAENGESSSGSGSKKLDGAESGDGSKSKSSKPAKSLPVCN